MNRSRQNWIKTLNPNFMGFSSLLWSVAVALQAETERIRHLVMWGRETVTYNPAVKAALTRSSKAVGQ